MMGKVLFSLISANYPSDQNGQGNQPKKGN